MSITSIATQKAIVIARNEQLKLPINNGQQVELKTGAKLWRDKDRYFIKGYCARFSDVVHYLK